VDASSDGSAECKEVAPEPTMPLGENVARRPQSSRTGGVDTVEQTAQHSHEIIEFDLEN
jgi:hypothetical protein